MLTRIIRAASLHTRLQRRCTTVVKSTRIDPASVAALHDLKPPPPPPPPPPAAPSPKKAKQPAPEHREPVEVLREDDFFAFLPTFFVPIRAVLHEIQSVNSAYSEAHLDTLFSTSQLVTVMELDGQKFIKAHGGRGFVDLAATAGADARFEEFMPSFALAQEFVPFFPKNAGWISLYDLVHAAPLDAVRQLPFKGPSAMLFFQQFPHLFTCSVSGELCLHPVYDARCQDCPCPRILCRLTETLRGKPTDYEVLTNGLSDDEATELAHMGFDTLQDYLRFVSTHFATCTGGVVMLKSERVHKKLETLPAAQQLNLTRYSPETISGSRKRSLRRQLELQKDPDNPLFEPEALARAVADWLPEDKFVWLTSFYLHAPLALRNCMPRKQLKFLTSHPEHICAFEMNTPNNWALQRAHLPLPPGALKQRLESDELLRCIAEELANGPMRVSVVNANLSQGARETLNKEYQGLGAFVLQHPEYFSVVETSDDKRVSLLRTPE